MGALPYKKLFFVLHKFNKQKRPSQSGLLTLTGDSKKPQYNKEV